MYFSKSHSSVIIGGTLDQTPIVTVDQLLLELLMLKDHPLKNMVDKGIFDSGCSGHMTRNKDQLEYFEEFNRGSVTFGGNKDQLEDFEEFNGGSVTFGGSKGYISGKGGKPDENCYKMLKMMEKQAGIRKQ
ncbi:hypothetical protein Tco_0202698 [Tanacetum coccineum]